MILVLEATPADRCDYLSRQTEEVFYRLAHEGSNG
ncbi:MAG: hypothetical protein AVDCRST_MAG86-221, partial [uncultured Truepera sp.]